MADVDIVTEPDTVFERLEERVLVGDRLGVLLCPELLLPLTDTV